MEEVERRHILMVLDAVGGNKTVAAQILGFDRRTLYRKLERALGASATRRRAPSGEHPAARAPAEERPKSKAS
jgi:two-component system response regulator HydG